MGQPLADLHVGAKQSPTAVPPAPLEPMAMPPNERRTPHLRLPPLALAAAAAAAMCTFGYI